MGVDGDWKIKRVVSGEFLVSEREDVRQFVARGQVAVLCAPIQQVGPWQHVGFSDMLRWMIEDGRAQAIDLGVGWAIVVVPLEELSHDLGREFKALRGYNSAGRGADAKYRTENPQPAHAYGATPEAAAYQAWYKGLNEAVKAASGDFPKLVGLDGCASFPFAEWEKVTPGRWIVSRYYISGCGDEAPYYCCPLLPEGVVCEPEIGWELWT